MKVCVFGAGNMGARITEVFLNAGHDVTMVDIKPEFTERGKTVIAHDYEFLVGKGKMTAERKDELLNSLKTSVDRSVAADADFVMEVILERMDLKKDLLEDLDKICPDRTIFASNTSSLSITEMGQGLKHHLIGMHFFNPVPAMKLVEVIAGGNTPADLVDYIKNLSVEIGKTPVVVNEAPGFVVNKILIPYCNEGVCVLQEGVASAEDIDIAMQLGCNHPMGPLHLGDLIGWDVVLNIMDVLFNETHDSKYRANVLIRKMVRAGKLGIKSGEGFFNYNK